MGSSHQRSSNEISIRTGFDVLATIVALWRTGESAKNQKVTAPAALLIAVAAEAHLLRLPRVSDDVPSNPEHERLRRAFVEHVWCRPGEASSKWSVTGLSQAIQG
jgi:hypothetical protein